MAEPHVVSALVAKRAELAGEIENRTRELQSSGLPWNIWTRRCACSIREPCRKP
jgi:hypothetical protein